MTDDEARFAELEAQVPEHLRTTKMGPLDAVMLYVDETAVCPTPDRDPAERRRRARLMRDYEMAKAPEMQHPALLAWLHPRT